jgi:hypothetical protein
MFFLMWRNLRKCSTCVPTAYEVVRDCSKLEKYWFTLLLLLLLLSSSSSSSSISVFQCYTGFWFPVAFHHICRITASSGVKLFCFISLSILLSHLIYGGVPLLLPSSEQVIIRLGHVLSSMRNTCPYHFNTLFSILSKIVCVTPIFL